MTIRSLIFIVLLVAGFGYACSSGKAKRDTIQEGEKLARTHCVGCHSFPEPGLLDKNTWIGSVLPEMGKRMNVAIYYNPFDNKQRNSPDQAQSTLFPTEQWNKIVDWYKEAAPDHLNADSSVLLSIANVLPGFLAKPISFLEHPTITFLGFDNSSNKFLVGDALVQKVYTISDKLIPTEMNQVGVGIADLKRKSPFTYALTMGILKPSDQPLGSLHRIGPNGKSTLLIDSLLRPIHFNFADLNQDKLDDIIVCEFGYNEGSLSWFDEKGKKHVLKNLPGAIATRIVDFNRDGKADILVLMAQAQEGIFLYTNQGEGKF